ncbi:MAG: hypothetical protein K6L75_16105 [Cellvibrionaceae bacterium]
MRSFVRFYFSLAIFLCVGLVGCVQQSSIETSEVEIEEEGPQSELPTSSRAVQNMVVESNKLLANGDWEGAIAMAERGMRIDRRIPELYLVIAKGYAGLEDFSRANQFAQQGLRYAEKSSSEEVIESLRHLEGLKGQ